MKNVRTANTLEVACSSVACYCPSDCYKPCIILREGLEGLLTEWELKVQRGERHCPRLHSRLVLMAAGVELSPL